jgi:hypothetical protein
VQVPVGCVGLQEQGFAVSVDDAVVDIHLTNDVLQTEQHGRNHLLLESLLQAEWQSGKVVYTGKACESRKDPRCGSEGGLMVPRCAVHHAKNVWLRMANTFEKTSKKWDRPTRWFCTTIEIAEVDAKPKGIGSSLYDDKMTAIYRIRLFDDLAQEHLTLTKPVVEGTYIESDQAGNESGGTCVAGRREGLDPRSERDWTWRNWRSWSRRGLGRAW